MIEFDKIEKDTIKFLNKIAQQVQISQKEFGADDVGDALRGIVTDPNNGEELHPKLESFIQKVFTQYNDLINKYNEPDANQEYIESLLSRLIGDYRIFISVTPQSKVDVRVGNKLLNKINTEEAKKAILNYIDKVGVPKTTVTKQFGDILGE